MRACLTAVLQVCPRAVLLSVSLRGRNRPPLYGGAQMQRGGLGVASVERCDFGSAPRTVRERLSPARAQPERGVQRAQLRLSRVHVHAEERISTCTRHTHSLPKHSCCQSHTHTRCGSLLKREHTHLLHSGCGFGKPSRALPLSINSPNPPPPLTLTDSSNSQSEHRAALQPTNQQADDSARFQFTQLILHHPRIWVGSLISLLHTNTQTVSLSLTHSHTAFHTVWHTHDLTQTYTQLHVLKILKVDSLGLINTMFLQISRIKCQNWASP